MGRGGEDRSDVMGVRGGGGGMVVRSLKRNM